MIEPPLVSVIIPCYNHAAYIEKAIQSILDQNYPNIQLLAIDDGSRDRSPELIAAMASKYGFYFEAQNNIGLAATLNKAINLSNGKYICSMGSDDIAFLDKIEKQVRFMESNPQIAVCGSNVLVIDESGSVQKKQKNKPYAEFGFYELFSGRDGIAAPTAMIRTDVIKDVGLYDPTIRLEDMYMWLKITSHGHKIARLSEPLLYYRKHAYNTYKNYSYMYDNMMKIYSGYQSHPEYKNVIGRYSNSMFVAVAKSGDQSKALSIAHNIPLKMYNKKTLKGYFYVLKGGKF